MYSQLPVLSDPEHMRAGSCTVVAVKAAFMSVGTFSRPEEHLFN